MERLFRLSGKPPQDKTVNKQTHFVLQFIMKGSRELPLMPPSPVRRRKVEEVLTVQAINCNHPASDHLTSLKLPSPLVDHIEPRHSTSLLRTFQAWVDSLTDPFCASVVFFARELHEVHSEIFPGNRRWTRCFLKHFRLLFSCFARPPCLFVNLVTVVLRCFFLGGSRRQPGVLQLVSRRTLTNG
jgi:hypothetical protein